MAADANVSKIHKPFRKRSCKFTPEQLYEGFNEYMEFLEYEEEDSGENQVPTLVGFSDHLWINRETLRQYGMLDEYKEVVEYIASSIEGKILKMAFNSSNSRIHEYYLNNRMPGRWSNKQTIETKDTTLKLTDEERKIALDKASKDLIRLRNGTSVVDK